MPEGEELALLTGHRVRAVAVDAPGTGYAVTGPSGHRLLYLPAGCGPAGLAARSTRPVPYDMVLLDVVRRPDALARLRAAGLVGPTTDVIAVHLGHDAPPPPETRRRLAAAGARAVPDGRPLTVGEYEAVPDVPRRTLVLGGARSGKSAEAERRLASFPGVVYVATGGTRDGDPEWAGRVRLHRERRPASWRTEETQDLVPLLRADGPPLLIDCLAAVADRRDGLRRRLGRRPLGQRRHASTLRPHRRVDGRVAGDPAHGRRRQQRGRLRRRPPAPAQAAASATTSE